MYNREDFQLRQLPRSFYNFWTGTIDMSKSNNAEEERAIREQENKTSKKGTVKEERDRERGERAHLA